MYIVFRSKLDYTGSTPVVLLVPLWKLMHSKDYWNLQSGCGVNMSRCRNFTVFSFVMVSNNKKVRTISECYVASIV